MNIGALFPCLQAPVTATTLRPLRRMALARLVRPGRVTRLGLARWAGKGGSDRPVQRFFSQALPWARRFWVCFRQQVHRPEEVSLLVGDAVVVTKAGQHPYGLDRCFARRYGKPLPGCAFCAFALVRVPARRAFPGRVEPVVRREAEQAARKAPAAAQPPPPSPTRRRPGRPQGSKNTPQADVTRTPE
jgi:putative transposase